MNNHNQKMILLLLAWSLTLYGSEGEVKKKAGEVAQHFPIKIQLLRTMSADQIATAKESDVFGREKLEINAKDYITTETIGEMLDANTKNNIPTIIARLVTFNHDTEQTIFNYYSLDSAYNYLFDNPIYLTREYGPYQQKHKNPITNLPLVGKIRFYTIFGSAKDVNYFLYLETSDIFSELTLKPYQWKIRAIFQDLLTIAGKEEVVKDAQGNVVYEGWAVKYAFKDRSAKEKEQIAAKILYNMHLVLLEPTYLTTDKQAYQEQALICIERAFKLMQKHKLKSVQEIVGLKMIQAVDALGSYERYELKKESIPLAEVKKQYEALKAQIPKKEEEKKAEAPVAQPPQAPAKKPAPKAETPAKKPAPAPKKAAETEAERKARELIAKKKQEEEKKKKESEQAEWATEDEMTKERWAVLRAIYLQNKDLADYNAWTGKFTQDYYDLGSLRDQATGVLNAMADIIFTMYEFRDTPAAQRSDARESFIQQLDAIAPMLFGSQQLVPAQKAAIKAAINKIFTDPALRKQALEKAAGRI